MTLSKTVVAKAKRLYKQGKVKSYALGIKAVYGAEKHHKHMHKPHHMRKSKK